LDKIRPRTPTFGLVGGSTLLGREIRDLAAAPDFPARLRLIAAEDDEAGMLTEQAGEPAVIHLLDGAGISESGVTVFAGSPASTLKALGFRTSTIPVDLTFATAGLPNARLRAPFLEAAPPAAEAIHTIAHPASIALALFFRRLATCRPVVRAVVQALVPAAERGLPGLEELQAQTTNLFAFKSLPKAVFDGQLGFNLLAAYGQDAPESLAATEARIESHLATLLSWRPAVPMPSLRAVQAPVFHGYSFSVWAQFETPPDAAELERALASNHIDVRGAALDPPDIVAMAGEDGIAVGAIKPDARDPNAFWFWIATDNIRLAAQNALAVVRELIGDPA
jgi:aspartate-semialdehyde dehydrogenase